MRHSSWKTIFKKISSKRIKTAFSSLHWGERTQHLRLKMITWVTLGRSQTKARRSWNFIMNQRMRAWKYWLTKIVDCWMRVVWLKTSNLRWHLRKVVRVNWVVTMIKAFGGFIKRKGWWPMILFRTWYVRLKLSWHWWFFCWLMRKVKENVRRNW